MIPSRDYKSFLTGNARCLANVRTYKKKHESQILSHLVNLSKDPGLTKVCITEPVSRD